MNNKETLKLSNVTLNWAFLGHKNDKGNYASNKYEVTVIMSAAQAQEIRDTGLSAKQKIKELEDGTFKLTLKSNIEPLVFNKDGIAMTTEEKDKIGNGTVANVMANFYDARGQKFIGLSKVLVKNLVEYNGGSSAADLMDDDTATPDQVLEDD